MAQGEALFLDCSPDLGGWGVRLAFGPAAALRRADRLEDVPGVIDWAEAEARAGRWAVLALAYEAAPAFDAALRVHAPLDGLPLAWAASHAAPLAAPEPKGQAGGSFALGPWLAGVAPAEHAARLEALRELIAQGECYQANYTVPFRCSFSGDDRAWFLRLAASQRAGFCAWADLGAHRALSLSPELFFRREGRRVLARPMKGTAPASGDAAEDARRAEVLRASPKNRAENVMIVDLLRSDLGRVARPGGVDVPRLFHVDAYPTLLQMTSDVRAELRPEVGLRGLLAALFPCGSVTGAPKVRSMEILRELEPRPRGVYCGALGLLWPGGERAVFSVPIRTLLVEPGAGLARFRVGGGVTHDSDARDEYLECLVKMRCAVLPEQDFELLESLLLRRGRYPLLEGHLERLLRSAALFGFAVDEGRVRALLAELALAHPAGRFKVRLLSGREGGLRAEAQAVAGGRQRVLAALYPEPVDETDLLLGRKTTRRAVYDAALAWARGRDARCGDALLRNRRGELTESCLGNLVLQLPEGLVTPPASCGLLPGVFRARLLARGLVREAVLVPGDLARARRAWLVNAVRGWRRLELLPG